MHLAHPLGVKGFDNRRVKNDLKDATLLADLLRMGSLPESWIPPHSIRELRELVRYRHKLSQLRTGLKNQVHAALGKEGVIAHLVELRGPAGDQFLDDTRLGDAYQYRVGSLRDLIGVYDREIKLLDGRIHRRLKEDPGYRAIQQLNGVGRVHGAALVAEIGDVTRFRSPKHLCSWAGLTPRLRESDTTTHSGSITKQGSRLVRWTAVEAISSRHGGAPIRDHYRRIAERRGTNTGIEPSPAVAVPLHAHHPSGAWRRHDQAPTNRSASPTFVGPEQVPCSQPRSTIRTSNSLTT